MPIYAYKCSGCGHQLDVLQRVGDPLKVECPQCGQPALVKQVTAAGFQLKGSGWYVTDFREKAAAKKEGAPTPEGGAATTAERADSAAAHKPEKAPDKAPEKSRDKGSEKASDSGASTAPAAPAPAPGPPPAGSGGST